MRIKDFRQSYAHDEALWSTRVQRVWLLALLAALAAFPLVGGGYLTGLMCMLGIHIIAASGLNIMTGYTGLISLGHAAFMGVGCYTAAWLAQRGLPVFVTLPAAGLMAAIHAALPVGGTLLLAEPMADPDCAPAAGDAYYHFYLLAMGAGRLRTPAELMGLMAEAGFSHLELVPNPMPLHGRILLGRKSGGLPAENASDPQKSVNLN